MNLKEYLDSKGIKYGVFAQKVSLSKNSIYAILEGGDLRMSTALRICRETDGAVTLEELAPKKSKIIKSN